MAILQRGISGPDSVDQCLGHQIRTVVLNFEGGEDEKMSHPKRVDAGTHEVGFGQQSLSGRLVPSHPTPPDKQLWSLQESCSKERQQILPCKKVI